MKILTLLGQKNTITPAGFMNNTWVLDNENPSTPGEPPPKKNPTITPTGHRIITKALDNENPHKPGDKKKKTHSITLAGYVNTDIR